MGSTKYKYRFTIDDTPIYPVFDTGSSLRFEKEDRRVFLRLKLNGTFILKNSKRKDFNLIWAKDLEHEFAFKAQFLVNGIVVDEVNGTFYKTDCQFDEDNSITRIVVQTVDRYEKILKAIDKEYELVKELMPPKYNVEFAKECLMQIVFPYYNVMYNRIGDVSYLTQLSTVYTPTELEGFGFYRQTTKSYYIPGTGDMIPDVSGVYTKTADSFGYPTYTRTDNVFVISNNNIYWQIRVGSVPQSGTVLYQNSGVYDAYEVKSPFALSDQIFENILDSTVKCDMFPTTPYYRILTDAASFGGVPTNPIPQPDIDDLVFNYDFVADSGVDVPIDPLVIASDAHLNTPTQFGRFAEDAIHFSDEYFNPNTTPIPGFKSDALMKNSWTNFSLVVVLELTMQGALVNGTTKETLKDAYKLEEVIKYLLNKIDNSLTFDFNTLYSKFLFEDPQPISGGALLTHFITPKSNITNPTYDTPATKSMITFGQVDELIRNGLNAYWWIDGNGNFRIEHLHYFKNGRSYTTPYIGIDLTTQTEPTTGKKWAYHTKKYRYTKETMPEEIRFGWMDEVSEYFEGFPIKILSGFVEKGNFDDRKISAFTSDLGFTLANAQNISKDGFFVLAAYDNAGTWTVPFEVFDAVAFSNVYLQNGFWSTFNLNDKFFRHYLPSPNANLNNEDIVAITTKRGKEQIVNYPAPINPDPTRLVTSSIGDGEVSGMEINLTSRRAVITLLHDLDFDNPCPTC